MQVPFKRLSMLLSVAGGLAVLPHGALGQEVQFSVASQSGEFAGPLDAAPGPDGSTFYFTAIGPNGPGVFRVAASGGIAAAVAAGAPFVYPRGIAVSGDGSQVYVADPLAWAGGGKQGQIFVVPVGGGAPRLLRGADGRGARMVEIVSEGGQDFVYFSGYDPSNRNPGVYRIAATGDDAPAVLFEGAPLIDPDGVAVGRSGAVYVADRGNDLTPGAVFKVENGELSKVVDYMRPGNPAGIAVSLGESHLLISSLQPYRNRAQVLVVDLATLELSTATNVIGQKPGAGGLHRARDVAIYAWVSAPMGPIYKVMTAGMVF